MKLYAAIDVGGTEIKYAVINDAGEILYHDSSPTPRADYKQRIPEELLKIMRVLLEKYGAVQGIGISTAGVVDSQTGEIIFAGGTMPGYVGTNLKICMEQAYGLPTHVANDVNAAAIGEKWKGAARRCDHFFCLTIGTGIGGALYCGGRLVTGQHHRAGEIGHSLFDKVTRTTYEQRASMTALLKMARESGFPGTPRELFDEARAGSGLCNEIIEGWAEEIARGLAEIILITDPGLIIIGGGVSEQKEFLTGRIRPHLNAYLPDNFCKTEIRTALLGNKAALLGAVYPFFESDRECEESGRE
ncbi:ROK family protein [Paenibacillus sp. FJAT-26967]|uniref:ROK family protein n=1 Tax=Paenibacillus sp. FJAT-26967 TaxID=1729690 RepID=UPI00083926BC|nr:ROK family protein [Paenibacillus sp. FJAT-26967]